MKDSSKEAFVGLFGDTKVRMSQCVYDFFSLMVDFGSDISHLISIPVLSLT